MTTALLWAQVRARLRELEASAEIAVRTAAGSDADPRAVEQRLEEINRIVTKAKIPLRQIER